MSLYRKFNKGLFKIILNGHLNYLPVIVVHNYLKLCLNDAWIDNVSRHTVESMVPALKNCMERTAQLAKTGPGINGKKTRSGRSLNYPMVGISCI